MEGKRYAQLRSSDATKLADNVLHEKLSLVSFGRRKHWIEAGAPRHWRQRPEHTYFHLVDTFIIALRVTKYNLNDFLATPSTSGRAVRLADYRRGREQGGV